MGHADALANRYTNVMWNETNVCARTRSRNDFFPLFGFNNFIFIALDGDCCAVNVIIGVMNTY